MNKQIALQRTRMYAALRESHPLYFGDPIKFYGYSGPAWGERNGKAAGLVGAVLAVATGGLSLGFTTLASTLSTISVIGSVVGAVTGNKAFSTIGALAGLGSAFMSLSSAGAFGKDMATWAGDTNAAIMGTGAEQAAAPFTDSIAHAVGGEAAITGGASTVTEVGLNNSLSGVNILDSANLAQADGIISTQALPSVDTLANQAVAGTTPQVAGVDAIADSVAPGAPAITGQPAAGTSTPLDIAKIGEPINAMQASAQQGGNLSQIKAASDGVDTGTNLFDRMSKFANENKAFTEILAKTIQGAYTSSADKDLKEAQTNLYNAKTGEINGQVANANAIADVTRMQVNPNATIYRPNPAIAAGVRSPGLIQQPRKL